MHLKYVKNIRLKKYDQKYVLEKANYEFCKEREQNAHHISQSRIVFCPNCGSLQVSRSRKKTDLSEGRTVACVKLSPQNPFGHAKI